METNDLSHKTGVRVLVVEDDMMIIDMVTQKLKDSNFDVLPVIDGAEALEKATVYEPKVIVLDLMLPNVSGEEILKELKSQSVLANIPVIVFTNKNREENENTVKALGAEEYFVKASTSLESLIKRIQELAK